MKKVLFFFLLITFLNAFAFAGANPEWSYELAAGVYDNLINAEIQLNSTNAYSLIISKGASADHYNVYYKNKIELVFKIQEFEVWFDSDYGIAFPGYLTQDDTDKKIWRFRL